MDIRPQDSILKGISCFMSAFGLAAATLLLSSLSPLALARMEGVIQHHEQWDNTISGKESKWAYGPHSTVRK